MGSDGARRLRLLSLDGGGIRGLSTIMILKDIMRGLNRGRAPGNILRPYQVFDLIGGTSTGGMLAVMLGRLRMSVEECEVAYLTMSERIFNPKRGAMNIVGRAHDVWKVEGRFDSDELNASIWEILSEQGASREELLQDPYGDCKVFVCAVLTSNTSACVLRSYPNDYLAELLYETCTIWEACRATSAATSFFDPITIGPYGQKFADGAVKYNNPIQLVYREAETLWPLKARDAMLISLGTGSAPSPALEGNIVKVVQALKEIVIQSESAADDFFSDHGQMADNEQLYRFNVYHGLGDIGLEEYKEKRRIADATHAYLTNGETRQRWRRCVQKLGDEERPAICGRNLLELSPPVSANMSLPIRSHEWKNLTLRDTHDSSFALADEMYPQRTNIHASLGGSTIAVSPAKTPDTESAPPKQIQEVDQRLTDAVKAVSLEGVRNALQSGADVVSKRANPLALAATIGETDIVSLLVQNGGQINMLDETGQSPLFHAAANGNFSTAKFLLESGAYVHATDQNGYTPLLIACRQANEQLVKLLLDSGANMTLQNISDMNFRKGSFGHTTATHEAVSHNQLGVIKVLLNAGSGMEIANHDGRTPFLVACIMGLCEAAAVLLDNGANIEATSSLVVDSRAFTEATGLFAACILGHEKVVELLVSRGAKVDATATATTTTGFGTSTGLHQACVKGHEKVVKLLVEGGADVEARATFDGRPGNTPLVQAALCRVFSPAHRIITYLLSKGADPDVKDPEGRDAVYYARWSGNGGAIWLLKKASKKSAFSLMLGRMFFNACVHNFEEA